VCFVLAIMICSNSTTFDQLFLRKVTKTDAIDALISAQNAPICVWKSGSARTRWGSWQHSPRSPSWIQGEGGGMHPILYQDLGDRSPWVALTSMFHCLNKCRSYCVCFNDLSVSLCVCVRICEALLLANDHLLIPGTNGSVEIVGHIVSVVHCSMV